MSGAILRKTGLFTAAVLFLIFFVWPWVGNENTYPYPMIPAIIFFLVLTAFFAVSRADTAFIGLLKKLETRQFLIFPLTAFVSSLLVSHFVFSGLPHVPDEINYKYLAEAILDGRITSGLHPHYEFFNILYAKPDISGTYSIYQIGYSIFLAPFVFFKVPFLCNPLLTALSVFLIGKITEEFYGKTVAFITMALASLSLFTVLLGGTLMAHSFCAACTLAALYFSILSLKNIGRKRYVFIVISALSISFLMFIRPQNALFALLFVLLYMFVFIDKISFFKIVPVMGSVIFVLFLVFLYSNYTISGSITELKHEKYWNILEPVDDCMGLGLGKGCRFGTAYEMPEEGLTLPLAASITAKRLYDFVTAFTFNPLMFLFVILLFTYRKPAALFKKDLILLTGFLIFPVVYFFYYSIDFGYGSRYYYECSFFLFPLMAGGIILTYEKAKKFYFQPLSGRTFPVTAFIISSFVFQYVFSLPSMLDYYSKGSWNADKLLSEALKEKNIEEGVFFVFPDSFYANGVSLMNLHKIDENKMIFAHDLGFKSNQNLMDYYKNKKFYLVLFNTNENKPPQIHEIERDSTTTEITVEAEHKGNPVDGVPDYCGHISQYSGFTDKYSGFAMPQEITSGRIFFFCRFTEKNQFYTFGQYFEKEGKYRVLITFAATPLSGNFSFETGNFSKKLDFYSANPRLENVEFEVFFEKGMNFIKLTPDFKEKGVYFIIDKFEFFPVDEV